MEVNDERAFFESEEKSNNRLEATFPQYKFSDYQTAPLFLSALLPCWHAMLH
jgi:hypothetical protein